LPLEELEVSLVERIESPLVTLNCLPPCLQTSNLLSENKDLGGVCFQKIHLATILIHMEQHRHT